MKGKRSGPPLEKSATTEKEGKRAKKETIVPNGRVECPARKRTEKEREIPKTARQQHRT